MSQNPLIMNITPNPGKLTGLLRRIIIRGGLWPWEGTRQPFPPTKDRDDEQVDENSWNWWNSISDTEKKRPTKSKRRPWVSPPENCSFFTHSGHILACFSTASYSGGDPDGPQTVGRVFNHSPKQNFRAQLDKQFREVWEPFPAYWAPSWISSPSFSYFFTAL